MVSDLIFRRKSIRSYTDEDISDDIIKRILAAAMQAPSALNTQSWEFIVVKNKDMILNLSKMSKYASCAKGANTLIVVLANLDKLKKNRAWFPQDLSAATENILLEATNQGVGSVWLGLYPDGDRISYVKDCLNLPLHVLPFSIVSLGYPIDLKNIENRYDESKIHMEKY